MSPPHSGNTTRQPAQSKGLSFSRPPIVSHADADPAQIFHLPDGPEQEARDASMRAAMHTSANASDGNPNQWADQHKNDVQFGYDADIEAERWWAEEGQFTVGRLEVDEKMYSRL